MKANRDQLQFVNSVHIQAMDYRRAYSFCFFVKVFAQDVKFKNYLRFQPGIFR